MTFDYTDAVLANDTVTAAALWQSVGGTGEIACLGTTDSAVTYDSATSAVAFGSMTIHNATPGFTLPRFSVQFRADSAALDHNPYRETLFGIAYGNGPSCDTYSIEVIPNMAQDDWGPVPIVILFGNDRSPEHPDGDPTLPTIFLQGIVGGPVPLDISLSE